jgi:hypothetical protein
MKMNPHWVRKVPSKITGCSASLTVKSYLGTDYLLGIYDAGHNHAVGPENLRLTRISSSTRDWIAALVQTHVKTKEIVCLGVQVCLEICQCILISVSSLNCCSSVLEATFRIQLAITLSPLAIFDVLKRVLKLRRSISIPDGISVALWAEKLRSADSLLKSR